MRVIQSVIKIQHGGYSRVPNPRASHRIPTYGRRWGGGGADSETVRHLQGQKGDARSGEDGRPTSPKEKKTRAERNRH